MVSKSAFNHVDIHNYAAVLAAYVGKIDSAVGVSAENRETLRRYYRAMINDGLESPTIIKHLPVVINIAQTLQERPFLSLQRTDLEEMVYRVRSNSAYSPWTVHKHLVSYKKFFKWLHGGDDYPECVKWIKSTVADKDVKLPDSLVTQEEVKRMLNACQNPRDQCMLSMLNEMGCRVGELLSINIRQLEDCEDYFRVTIQHSKTLPRKLKLLDSKPFIARWLNSHPKLQGPDSPLFVGIGSKNKNERLAYGACRVLIGKIAHRCNVTKAVNPHNWRHSTATRYAKFMSYSQLCNWFGWKIGSKTASIYVHLSGQDMDDVVDQMRGIKPIKKLEDTLAAKKCLQCGKENQGINDLCEQCGAALTIAGILKKEDRLQQLELEMKARMAVLEKYIEFKNYKLSELEKQTH